MINNLYKEYAKKQYLPIAGDKYTDSLIRMTFALLLKITGTISDWVVVLESNEQKSKEKIYNLWSSASQVRAVFCTKRNLIPEIHTEQELENDIKEIVKEIKDKIELLFKFRSAVLEEQEKMNSYERVQLPMQPTEKKSRPLSETEAVKERLAKWKDIQLLGVHNEFTLSSSVIQILKSNITAPQLISQLENYYLRAIVLYNVMTLMQYAIHFLLSKSLRADVLAWIMTIFKRTTTAPWHYSQFTTSCGVAFQSLLRAAFFGVMKQVLEYIAIIKDKKEMRCLMDALKWNYTATDYENLNKCKLFSSLRGNTKGTYISSLWGAQSDDEDQTPSLLLDTFEFILIKITTRILGKVEPQDSFPGLEKTFSLVDESSTSKLFEAIVTIVFGEFKRAVETYESAQGIDHKLIEDYMICKKGIKNGEKDAKRISKEFIKKNSVMYSQEFCTRLLGLIYRLFVAIQDNTEISAVINLLIQPNDLLQFLKLLKVGSVQHQFIILQTLPFIANIAYECLETASARVLEGKRFYTQSNLIDFLINFIMEYRQSMWTKDIGAPKSMYSITKTAIFVTRKLISKDNAFWDILRSGILEGKYTSKHLMDTMLSIAGGEFLSLFKGCKANVKDKEGYVVTCFRGEEEVQNYEYEYEFKFHTHALLHRVRDKTSARENSLLEVNISEVIPTEEQIDLTKFITDIKTIKEVLSRVLTDKMEEDAIVETIKVRILRIMRILLERKELAEEVADNDLIRLLIDLALKKPKNDRPLLIAEMQIEEMRKEACQSKEKALAASRMTEPKAKFFKKEIWLVLNSNSLAIPLISCKMLQRLDRTTLDYVIFNKDMKVEEAMGKILFVPENPQAVIKEFITKAKAFVIAEPLKAFNDIKIPIAQIRSKDMKSLETYSELLIKSNTLIENNKLDQMIAKFANKKLNELLGSLNAKTRIGKLSNKLTEDSKITTKVPAPIPKPLRVFSEQRRKCDKMFKESKDLDNLKSEVEKSFTSAYYKIYNEMDIVIEEKYKDILLDLKLLNTRYLLVDLLIISEANVKVLSIKKLIDFLLIMMIEADYMAYGFCDKKLSKKISKILEMVIGDEFFEVFIEWFKEGVRKTKETPKQTPNLFKSTTSELLDTIYVHFLYKVFKLFLKLQPKKIVTYVDVSGVMVDLLSLVILVESPIDKYKCILLIKELLGAAQTLKHELTVNQLNNLLANKAMKALSEYCKTSCYSISLLWKNMKEIILKASALYRFSLSKYGDLALSYCTSGDGQLFTAVEIMKSFPEMEKLLIYTWIRMYSSRHKVINESHIESPKPFYDTQYCLLIQDMQAQSIQVEWKMNPNMNMALTLDKEIKAPLEVMSDANGEYTDDFNRFYVQYPVKTFDMYGFGSNAEGELGLQGVESITKPELISDIKHNRIEAIYTGKNYTIIIDIKGNMNVSGKGKGYPGSSNSKFKPYARHGISPICATGKSSSILFDPLEKMLHVYGKNPNFMYAINKSDCRNSIFRVSAKSLRQISVGNEHVLMLYKDKELYGSPACKKEFFGKVEDVELKFNLVQIRENIVKIEKALALAQCTILLCITSPHNKSELYSFGVECPELGQEETKSTDQYERLSYPTDIEFTHLTGYDETATAITNKGELYIWGNITNFKSLELYLKDSTPQKINKPTKVKLDENYKVISVSISETHMLLLVEDVIKGKKLVLGFGENKNYQLGVKDQSVTKSVLTFFEDKNPYLIAAGCGFSIVACGSKPKGIYHKECICANHKREIYGTLYLVSVEEYYCKECEDQLPDICLVINNPIKNIKEKAWPNLRALEDKEEEKVICKLCKESINKGIVYHSAIKDNLRILCEGCYFKLPPTLTPYIHYRVSSIEIIATKTFPMLRLNQLYNTFCDPLALTIVPKYTLNIPSIGMDKEFKLSLKEFIEESKTFDRESDIDIVDLLNDKLTTNNEDINSLSLKNEIELPFNKKQSLYKYKGEVLSRRVKVLIKLNKIINNSLRCIDFDTDSNNEYDLYNYYKKIKDYITIKTKDEIVTEITNETPSSKGNTECVLYRHKAYLLKTSGGVDHTGEHTIYGQLWRILKDKVHEFRKNFRHDRYPFTVKFKGDGGVDVGGLFRECLDEICEELQSELLPLLIPTPNNKTGHGEYREKWTINPSASQRNHLEMFSFLGSLIGMSFRLSHLLPLNLTSAFWKQLVGETLDRNDLKSIDAYCVQCLEDITDIEKKGIDAASFESVIYETFVTRLSDGTQKELKAKGKDTIVTFENRYEYVQLVEKVRLEEGLKQMEAIRKGMLKVIPQSLVKLYSWCELEIKICGKLKIDVEALKKITDYNNCKQSDIAIQYFWEILTEFSDEERSLYLRFVWGRSRMPSYSEGCSHVICAKPGSSPNDLLPEAYTW